MRYILKPFFPLMLEKSGGYLPTVWCIMGGGGGGGGQGLSRPLPLWCSPLCAFSIAKYGTMLQIFCMFSRPCTKVGQIPLAALSKCAGSRQFCHLQSISCRLLHIGLQFEPSSRQGDLMFAAYYSFYVAYCYKTF